MDEAALICPTCIRRLADAHAFREESLKSDLFLKKKLEENLLSITVKKEPIDEDDDDFYDNKFEDHFGDDDVGLKAEPEVKVEDKPSRFVDESFESDDEKPLKPPAFANVTFEEDQLLEEAKAKTQIYSKRAKEAWARGAKANLIKDCPYCFLKGVTKTVLKKHIQEHLATNGGYECDHCQKKFKNKHALKNHIFSRHRCELGRSSTLQTYTCTECQGEFQGLRSFRNHYKEKHPYVPVPGIGNFTCYECGKQLSSKHCLEMHELTHTGLKPFVCKICNRGFRLKEYLKNHEFKHTGERPFLCTVCGKSFRTKENLQTHEPLHTGDFKFPCSFCEKKYRTKQLLQNHLTSHDEVPKHTCHICDKKFRQVSGLRYHLTTHDTNPELKFGCDICGKRFKMKGLLRSHLITHGDTFRFSCDVCGLKFKHASNWKGHQLSHSEERALRCGECGTPFKQRVSLKRHMRQHAIKLGLDENSFVVKRNTASGFKEEGFILRGST